MTKNLKKKYEDLIDDLSRDTDDRYRDYLLEKPETMVVDNLIFDIEYLDSYYNCVGCRKRKVRSFCCREHDLELTEKDIDVIEDLLPELHDMFPSLKKAIPDDDFWVWGDEFEKIMLRKDSGDCVFVLPDASGCMIHKWALDNDVRPLDYKPYVCSLYPVVVVVIGDDVVITTVNDESAKILDTGDQKTSRCTVKRGKQESHTIIQSKDILLEMFGEKTYKKLYDEIFSNKK